MAKKRPMCPDDYYLLRMPMDPQLSPDGRRVAFTVVWNDKEADEARTAIHVAPADGSAAPRRFTQGTRDHSPRWSPDGRHLAFVSDRGSKNQLFLAPLDGGEPRQLTSASHGIAQPAWSPDGSKLAYIARVGASPDRKAARVVRTLRYKLDGVGFFDDRRLHVSTVDLETGTEAQVTDGDWTDEHPAWSKDGQTIAFVSDRETDRHDRQFRTDLWLVPAGGGRPRKLTRSRGAAYAPAFSPDGRFVAFVGHEHGEEGASRNTHLYVVPVSGGAPRSLSASLDRSVVGMVAVPFGSPFVWLSDSSLLGIVQDRGTQVAFRFRLDGRAPKIAITGERQIEALSSDGKRVAFVSGWPNDPIDLYACTTAGVGVRNVGRVNDELRDAVALSTVDRMKSRAPDGVETESLVLLPPGKPQARRPALLRIHGGPHGWHPAWFSWFEDQVYAGAGYTVLLPNPRGSMGYGEQFTKACVEDWGGGDFDDLMSAADALVESGLADPAGLYVGGYSYGGFMTSWVIGHTGRFRAALVGAPVSNQLSMIGTSDIPNFTVHEMGASPFERPDEYLKRSPVTYLSDVTTPVLLLHREGDLRCPIAQSEEIFAGLRMLGKEVEMVRYPGGSHGMALPSHRVDEMSRAIAWYNAHC